MTEERARKLAEFFCADSGQPTDVINHYLTDEERRVKIENMTKVFMEYANKDSLIEKVQS